MTKFKLETWKTCCGEWAGRAVEILRWRDTNRMPVVILVSERFKLRDEVLNLLKREVDKHCLPETTLVDHGEYP